MKCPIPHGLVIAIVFMSGSIAVSDDYQLRIQTFESHSASDVEGNVSDAKIVSEIQLVTRSGERFRTKVLVGNETLTVAGLLTEPKTGEFKIQLRYVRSADPDRDSKRNFDAAGLIPVGTSISTTLNVLKEIPVELGGHVSVIAEPGKETVLTKTRTVLTLMKLDDDDK